MPRAIFLRVYEVTLLNEEKRTLLQIARRSVEAAVQQHELHNLESGFSISPALRIPCGAFCTLEVHHRLRGCIGIVEAHEPLYRIVSHCAASAATRDDRFTPIRLHELKALHVEISVLSPLKRITGPAEIEIGRHGLLLISGYHHGLLLPQVATEYGWDRETFLKETCRKAMLPADAWTWKETEIKSFTADVFDDAMAL
jgi:AmmeMemoRadiSam system protein A